VVLVPRDHVEATTRLRQHWMKPTPLDPFYVTGAPHLFEFRVPTRYLGEARQILQRVEDYPVAD
jgi:hypothetical protein